MTATIILVDDEPLVRDMLHLVLEGAGYTVADYSNGRGAIEHLQRRPADLLITDIFMPEVDGLETIRRACALRPEMPIIAISGISIHGIDYLDAAERFGAVATLRKPISPAALLTLVGDVLAHPMV